MANIKETIGLAVISLLFCLFTWALISSYIEEYDLLSMEPASGIVTEKTGTKSLFKPPAYNVRVLLPNGKESPYLHRVSKKQLNAISVGDRVEGYSAHSADFSTIRDIFYDSLFYFFGIIILGFIAFCCLVAFVFSIPGIERLEKKTPSKRKKKRKRKKRNESREQVERSGWRIAWSVIFIFLLFLTPAAINTVRKLWPFGKTEKHAMIVDTNSYVTYRRHEDSSYELTISFLDHAGNHIRVIKDVTNHTYQQYNIGDILPITYRNANPYDLFVPGTSIWDIYYAVLTAEAFVYMVIIAVTVFVGWAYWTGGRKKKA